MVDHWQVDDSVLTGISDWSKHITSDEVFIWTNGKTGLDFHDGTFAVQDDPHIHNRFFDSDLDGG